MRILILALMEWAEEAAGDGIDHVLIGVAVFKAVADELAAFDVHLGAGFVHH